MVPEAWKQLSVLRSDRAVPPITVRKPEVDGGGKGFQAALRWSIVGGTNGRGAGLSAGGRRVASKASWASRSSSGTSTQPL